MKEGKLGTRLVVVALLLLQVSLQQSTNHQSTIDRAARLLQSGTNTQQIEIMESPDVRKYCDDDGVKKEDITISIETRNQKREDTPRRYPALVEVLDASMDKGNSNSNDVSSKVAGSPAGFAGVMAILSFLSLIFLFFWSITECCCEKTCCVDKQKKMEGRGWVRWCCFLGTIILGVACVAMTIAWSVLVGKFTSKAKEIKCSFTILHNDLINGAVLSEDSRFAGITGVDTLMNQIITFFDAIDGPGGIKPNGQNIKNRDLATPVTTMKDKYTSFKTSFNANTYSYSGTTTSAITVYSGYGIMIKGSIESGALQAEVNTLASVATSIDKAADTIVNYDSAEIQKTKSELESARTDLTGSVKKPLDDFYKQLVTGGTDYFKKVKDAGTGIMAAAIVIIIAFTLVFFLILFMNIKDKWHKGKCISKIIMLLQLLIALIILIMSVFGVIVSVVIAWMCTGLDGMIATEGYLSTSFKGLNVDQKFVDITNTCIYKDGNGDLFKALGMNLSSINKINDITDGLQEYTAFKSNLTGQSAPFIGGSFSEVISSGIDYNSELRGSPQEQDIVSGREKFNYFGCAQDIMRLNVCPTDNTESTIGDAADASLNTKYCVKQKTSPSHDYAGRYSTPPACTNGTAANAQGVLTATSTASHKQNADLLLLQATYNNDFYTSELSVFTKLKDSMADLDIIVDKSKSLVDNLNRLNGTLSKLVDCRIMRKEIVMFENVVCFRIGEDYYQQTNVGIALGFLLFVYSWFMCCTIRLTNKKDDKAQVSEQPYYDPGYQNQDAKAYAQYN